MDMFAASLVPFLMLLVWLGAIVYLFALVRRLAYGVERIAAALERRSAGDQSRP